MNPYENIKFVTKHIEVVNSNRQVIFEADVEFPENFDENHAKIVASRYLCNTAKRKELSLKDMIDRVSDQITEWVRFGNYVDNIEEFNYKLKYYQINGYFAFNSPVYFNVGLCDKPQTSACFILEIEDNMESIFRLAQIEAQIFKYGSGSGVNMSSLRSSKEKVSRGGHACLTSDTLIRTDNDNLIEISKLYEYKKNAQNLPSLKCLVDKNTIGTNRIKNVVYNGQSKIYEIVTKSGFRIKCTGNHRFLIENEGYKEVRYFTPFDKICIFDDKIFFDKIEKILFVGFDDVYDIQMKSPYHNFIANGFISHNSGPVSFMKAHDVVAGVIKSGGTLRRSAKLVCLDDYHPDIEEFICCKDKEEEKLKAIASAGIKSEPGYDLSDEVFYQNTNISVRLSDKFMKAVENNDNWELRFINESGVFKTIKARDLLRKISEHAWKTGDPGVQFSDTFNKWNTVLNDGEIKSTNPCLPIWAPVLTPEGYKHFKDIKNKIFINNKEYSCSDVVKTKENEEVYAVKLENGICLYATKNHIIKTSNGDVELKNLKIGDKVKVCYDKIKFSFDQEEFEKGVISGYLFSQGLITNKTKNKNISFLLKKGELNYKEYFSELLKRHINNIKDIKYVEISPEPNEYCEFKIKDKKTVNYILKNILKSKNKESFDLFNNTISYQKGFVQSFISFAGYISKKHNCIKVNYASEVNEKLLYQIQLLLASLGIYSTISEISYNNDNTKVQILEIQDIKEFSRQFIFYDITKQIAINELLLISNNLEIDKELKEYQKVKNISLYSIEDVYDITVPDLNYFVSSCVVVHNCGEFAFLNNSSCNLASINLLKFFKVDRNEFYFDFDIFKDVIDIMITAQDALIDNSSYPTDKIEENSRNYRPLGAGYTNLGALLMFLGVPYDSEDARNIAAVLTGMETFIAYLVSNKIAEKLHPFKHFERNKSSFYRVLRQHIEVSRTIPFQIKNTRIQSLFSNIRERLSELADKLDQKIQNNANFRNAAVTLLAPTGTISSLMQATTTGIEPEFSLVRYKTLSNSEQSILKFVNSIVKDSLINLGYDSNTIYNILNYIERNGTAEGCKDIKSEHIAIFDTSICPQNFKRIIDYKGHIKMCAAVQPLLSMAISKTINMPETATVDDVYNLYIDAWRLGLKGVTIYRNNSKINQPLTVNRKDEIQILKRKKLPNDRKAFRHKFRVGNVVGYLSPGFYEDGRLGEIFIDLTKEGSTLSGFADALATIVSISLQYGVPLKDFVKKMMFLRFEPSGFTNNPEIRTCTSIVDYIFRYLGLHYLSEEEKREIGLISNGTYNKHEIIKNDEDDFNGPICPECGSFMRLLGSCWTCVNCAWNEGSCG